MISPLSFSSPHRTSPATSFFYPLQFPPPFAHNLSQNSSCRTDFHLPTDLHHASSPSTRSPSPPLLPSSPTSTSRPKFLHDSSPFDIQSHPFSLTFTFHLLPTNFTRPKNPPIDTQPQRTQLHLSHLLTQHRTNLILFPEEHRCQFSALSPKNAATVVRTIHLVKNSTPATSFSPDLNSTTIANLLCRLSSQSPIRPTLCTPFSRLSIHLPPPTPLKSTETHLFIWQPHQSPLPFLPPTLTPIHLTCTAASPQPSDTLLQN